MREITRLLEDVRLNEDAIRAAWYANDSYQCGEKEGSVVCGSDINIAESTRFLVQKYVPENATREEAEDILSRLYDSSGRDVRKSLEKLASDNGFRLTKRVEESHTSTTKPLGIQSGGGQYGEPGVGFVFHNQRGDRVDYRGKAIKDNDGCLDGLLSAVVGASDLYGPSLAAILAAKLITG